MEHNSASGIEPKTNPQKKYFFLTISLYFVKIVPIKQEHEIEQLKEQNQRLKTQVQWLKNQLFGQKSERLNPNQQELFEEGSAMGKPEPPLDSEEISEPEEANEKPKRKRKTKQELGLKNLPVIEAETLIPEAVKNNPEGYRKIGERTQDILDYQPGHLRWQRTTIPEYVSTEDKQQAPVKEPSPLPPVPNTMISPALAATLIIDKHCDHLPHYRQSQRFFREQAAEISHKTITAWVAHTARHLAPIAESIRGELLQSEQLQIDETPMHYLSPGAGKALTGYIWVMRDPLTGATYYHWNARRNTQALMELLGYDQTTGKLSFNGTIQCDGYICYQTLSNAYESIKLAACMAHIRRKFLDDKSLRLEAWIHYLLRAIKTLYRIERRLKNTSAPPDQIERTRQRYSKPIATKIKSLLQKHQPEQRPSSSCGKAIDYALGQWEQWQSYLTDGHIPIDNNGVENAIRPCKLGLKNYLFFGSLEAGVGNTVLYTLIENCKAANIHLRSYLVYVIEALHTVPASELTPAKVAAKWQASESTQAA